MVVGHEARHVCKFECADAYADSLGLVLDGEHFVYEADTRYRQIEYKIGSSKSSPEKSLAG